MLNVLKMCSKTVNNYPSRTRFVLEYYKTQEMYDTLVNTCLFVFHSVPGLYKTQDICDRVVSKDSFITKCCPNRYKTQNMCDEAVEDCLAALKCIPDGFVTSKMLEKFHDVLLTSIDIPFFD